MMIGKGAELNLMNLIDTRLLIQANSGGGKSWLIRRILEQTHGKVQHIVIDLEGEFNSLREKYDYLLVGKEGEIPANIKTAELLAKKLLELNVSTIVDLSELKHHERKLFVKRFLDSMINSPKKLWHPVLVIVDEAHQFCPQQQKSESASSVIDLCTRGRKRGFCAILATQRLSKLAKDAAAECNNVLIGRTGLDVDMKRASDILGFTSKEDMRGLRKLKAGEFFAFGPSIGDEIVKIMVGDVLTTHPKSGGRQLIKASPTPDNIKKILKNIIDLPNEAEEELKNLNDYKMKVNSLKRELRSAKSSNKNPQMTNLEITKLEARIRDKMNIQFAKELEKNGRERQRLVMKYSKAIRKIVELGNSTLTSQELELKRVSEESDVKNQFIFTRTGFKSITPRTDKIIKIKTKIPSFKTTSFEEVDIKPLGKCAKLVLSFLSSRPGKAFNQSQIGSITGYAPKSGGFNNALYQLNTRGLISRNKGLASVNEDRLDEITELLGNVYIGDSIKALEQWLNKLPRCPKLIYEILYENPYEEYTTEDLAERTGYVANTGGFNNGIYRLCSLGLAVRDNGRVKFNPELNDI